MYFDMFKNDYFLDPSSTYSLLDAKRPINFIPIKLFLAGHLYVRDQ